MGRAEWLGALLLAAALLCRPEVGLNAAREAMAAWAQSVAPALFPFMALTPLLTGAEAERAYERLFGKMMRPLFNLPGSAAPAIVIAMTAGSPAGAIAAARSAQQAGMTQGQLERIVCCTCGMSPAFLMTGIGASMLGSPASGALLLRSQIAAQLILLTAARGLRGRDRPAAAPPPSASAEPVRMAVSGTLNVCGYMMLFSVIGAMLGLLLPGEGLRAGLQCLLNLPSGAHMLCKLTMPEPLRLTLLAAAAGFGGLCIASQNLSACTGVRMSRYLAARLAQSVLMALLTLAQLKMKPESVKTMEILPLSALVACVLAVPVLIFWIKNTFLNRKNLPENAPILLKNDEKTQYVVVSMENKSKIM